MGKISVLLHRKKIHLVGPPTKEIVVLTEKEKKDSTIGTSCIDRPSTVPQSEPNHNYFFLFSRQVESICVFNVTT